jgi:hypothetical protein
MKKPIDPKLEESIKLLRELAEESPSTLTRILREAGCWVYLLHPIDITEHREDISYDEAKSAMMSFSANDRMNDELEEVIPYEELNNIVVERVMQIRQQNKKNKRK